MRLIVVFLFLVVSPLAQADAVLYTFTGANGLSGQFTLDDAAVPQQSGQFPNSIEYRLSSPLHSISGAYGDYLFQGTNLLQISDAPASNDVTWDFWIVRSGAQVLAPNTTLSGPPVNGVSPVLLNLFVYSRPSDLNGFGLTPPPHPQTSFNFHYTIKLSDGTITTADLHTLTRVPEPSTLLLLLSGIWGLAWATRVRRG
jgi:hypothetical protein